MTSHSDIAVFEAKVDQLCQQIVKTGTQILYYSNLILSVS